MKEISTKKGEKVLINDIETEAFHFGQWKEILEDQDGEYYIMGGLNPIYLDLRPSPKGQAAKFTPGPWELFKESTIINYDGWKIAEMYKASPERENSEANARLIAAAPDMYKALKELIYDVKEWQEYNQMQVESFDSSERALQQSVANDILARLNNATQLVNSI